jgi:hypothetical protein
MLIKSRYHGLALGGSVKRLIALDVQEGMLTSAL